MKFRYFWIRVKVLKRYIHTHLKKNLHILDYHSIGTLCNVMQKPSKYSEFQIEHNINITHITAISIMYAVRMLITEIFSQYYIVFNILMTSLSYPNHR